MAEETKLAAIAYAVGESVAIIGVVGLGFAIAVGVVNAVLGLL